MPEVLRFGISSLDELLGFPSEKSRDEIPLGIYLPPLEEIRVKPGAGGEKTVTDQRGGKELFTTSVCIIGPTGTGKSIFGLHMASTYLADCMAEKERKPAQEIPSILYVSTDLTYNMAQRAWSNFALNYPFARSDPFFPQIKTRPPDLREILLKECNPISLARDFDLLEAEHGNVIFVDMASYTAGDDWGFLHKLLSLLPAPEKETNPRHLVVIDAIEGFEALAGELNAFGEKSTRRSRIAQVMRLIAGKCHALLVVEQSKNHVHDESLAEEFVADTVIRLDSLSTRNYERRVLKVEKVRGQSHIRGQHHYSIRSGNGSTTGMQVNPDDPRIPAPCLEKDNQAKNGAENESAMASQHDSDASKASKPIPTKENEARQSYVQVFHSVHRISRKIMEETVEERLKLPTTFHAAFGIKYLDNMLAGETEITGREEGKPKYPGYYYDTRGLPCRSITALIGDSLTQKSTLGKAFLSRCFSRFDKRLEEMALLLKGSRGNARVIDDIWSRIRHKVFLLSETSNPMTADWEEKSRDCLMEGRLDDVIKRLEKIVGAQSIILKEDRDKWGDSDDQLLTGFAGWLLDYQTGVAVMLVTHNTHHEELARQFISWLYSESDLRDLNRRNPGFREALRNYIKGGTICRRLEIHSLSSEVLVHIVKQAVHAGQRRILTALEIQEPVLRYNRSWPVRVVIDDFSSLRNIFPELREDPLLFPSILFHFEREGVTTLIVDTQSGKPETTIAERFETELRQMVHHHLYTWRVPFYGESRVAITAIPPLSYEYAGIVRELRWDSESTERQHSEPATVDPHFELYGGLEEGKPEPVPLHARFYAETPAMEAYIALENNFLGEMFNSYAHPSRTGPPAVIFGVYPPAYTDLRALAYLQRDTRLDHTFLFQVDEFWTMRAPGRHKRAGAFQPQWSYLNAITANSKTDKPVAAQDYEPNPNEDPYELFQLRKEDTLPKNREGNNAQELRRKHFYSKYFKDFEPSDRIETGEAFLADRVPFSWDFGFLLCKKRAWETGRTFTIEGSDGSKKEHNVRQVWSLLRKAEYEELEEKQDPKPEVQGDTKDTKPPAYVSWRMFFEACKKVAEEQSDELSRPIKAFDFSQISPESFSSLLLEMWLSDIYDSLKKKIDKSKGAKQAKFQDELDRIVEGISKRHLFLPEAPRRGIAKSKPRTGGEKDPPADIDNKTERRSLSLSGLLKDYWLELYKSWLILIEVVDFSDIVGERTVSNFDFKSKNADFSAIASRNWYKTASQCPDEISAKEPMVAVRLPGHFSVRGDWFLAVSASSRSIRQGERALDLLNSRRSNVTRLELGIGLPTRASKLTRLRTKLISHQGGQDNVEYGTLLRIGAGSEYGTKDNFYWLWRSSLDDYANCNRIWHTWLNRTMLWWNRKLLRYRSRWRNSFEVYDSLTNYPPATEGDFAPADMAELQEVRKQVKLALTVEDKRKALTKYAGAHSVAQLKVRMGFLELWNVLREELKQACDRDY